MHHKEFNFYKSCIVLSFCKFLCLGFVRRAGDGKEREVFGGRGEAVTDFVSAYTGVQILPLTSMLLTIAICFLFIATSDPSIEVISLMKALHVLNLHWTTLYEVSVTLYYGSVPQLCMEGSSTVCGVK